MAFCLSRGQFLTIEMSSLKIQQATELMQFAGSLFWKEFNAVTTSDIEEQSGHQVWRSAASRHYHSQGDRRIGGEVLT
jgi:hypothetical protein